MCCATFANKNGQHSDIFEIIKAIVKDNFKVEDYNFILKRVQEGDTIDQIQESLGYIVELNELDGEIDDLDSNSDLSENQMTTKQTVALLMKFDCNRLLGNFLTQEGIHMSKPWFQEK